MILFDLKNDPQELVNVSSENPEIVKDLEDKLSSLFSSQTNSKSEDLSEEEQQKAEELLKKLGYI